jgi:hypothetical protein
MTQPKPKRGCKPDKPLCTACRHAAGLKRRVIFTTDTDPEAQRLRTEGAKLVRQLKRMRSAT